MKQKTNIHIVIYSEIFEYDGGRETWLGYFLPNLYEQDIFNNIYVYHLKPRSNKENISTKFKNIVSFNETDIGIPDQHNPFRNAYLYTCNTYYQLKQNMMLNDIVLVIGTRIELLPSILLKVKYRNFLKLIPWIRNISVGETISQRNRVFGLMVKIMESISFAMADHAICNGMDTYEYYYNEYKQLEKKLTLIENAVNINDYQMCKADFELKKVIIGYIGRFAPAKGFDQLIDAINRCHNELQRESIKSIEFHVWGHGSLEEIIPENVVNHGILSRQDVPKALSSCDCVVLLNKSLNNEAAGVSHSLLEAMAAGKLLVAWDNKVHNKILDQDNAFLIEEGNVQELANFFIKLAKKQFTKELLLSKSKKARKKANEYDISNHIDKFIKLLVHLRYIKDQ